MSSAAGAASGAGSILSRIWGCEWTIDQVRDFIVKNVHVDQLQWAPLTPESKEWRAQTTENWNRLLESRDLDYYQYVILVFMTDLDLPVFKMMTTGDSLDKMKAFYLILLTRMNHYWQGLLPGGQPIVIPSSGGDTLRPHRVRPLINDPISAREVVRCIMRDYMRL